MSLHPYPQSISQGIEAVTRLTAIIRGGNIAANKAEAGACVYTALGVALKTGLGDFVQPTFGAAADGEETEMQAAVVELASEVNASQGYAAAGEVDAGSVNWRELLKTLLPILLSLL
jgi:hypothetical protein